MKSSTVICTPVTSTFETTTLRHFTQWGQSIKLCFKMGGNALNSLHRALKFTLLWVPDHKKQTEFIGLTNWSGEALLLITTWWAQSTAKGGIYSHFLTAAKFTWWTLCFKSEKIFTPITASHRGSFWAKQVQMHTRLLRSVDDHAGKLGLPLEFVSPKLRWWEKRF